MFLFKKFLKKFIKKKKKFFFRKKTFFLKTLFNLVSQKNKGGVFLKKNKLLKNKFFVIFLKKSFLWKLLNPVGS